MPAWVATYGPHALQSLIEQVTSGPPDRATTADALLDRSTACHEGGAGLNRVTLDHPARR